MSPASSHRQTRVNFPAPTGGAKTHLPACRFAVDFALKELRGTPLIGVPLDY
jgi:hypothetical protein